ncbi:MAG TPA: L,D-transpeptidase [Anaerolineaceae bacterium]|nr:L,D-transpeptidase [Anaerolineaceae bacterium]
MKNIVKPFLSIMIALLLSSFVPSSGLVAAQDQAADGPEPYAGEALCLPDVYLQSPADCLPLGPSETLTQMASMGITYPIRPLAAIQPDPGLSLMPDTYLKVTKDRISLFASPEDAAAGNANGVLEAGMKYLATVNRVDLNGSVFYQLPSGSWIESGQAGAACCIVQGRYQGLIFHQDPLNSFGWILTDTTVKSTPGYNQPDTGRELTRENFVQVYGTQEADGALWVMIGMNEWIEDRVIARVSPNYQRPEGVDTDRWIEINLEEQVMLVYEHDHLIFATMVATGVQPFYTRPGLFKINQKKEVETMRGSFEADRSDYYYLENVPWTMYFDEARALHGAYWHTLFGYPQSHGCVNLSPGDAHWLFDWANEGDWVYVWDPSGKTPTDPAYYGAGGA